MTDPVVRWCQTHDTSFGENCRYPSGVPLNGCVIVDAVVLSRQPCNNCDGDGTVNGEPINGGASGYKSVPCPSCSGSGTTWPDELRAAIRKALGTTYIEGGTDGWIDFADPVLDALALVVQEGTDT